MDPTIARIERLDETQTVARSATTHSGGLWYAKKDQSFRPRKRPETLPSPSVESRMIRIASVASQLPVWPRIVFWPESCWAALNTNVYGELLSARVMDHPVNARATSVTSVWV